MGAGKPDIMSRVFAAASQGAVGAVVGATLSSVTEPVVNRILVKRITLEEALKEIKPEDMYKFFLTTLPTNLIKFPFFEVVNVIMGFVPEMAAELRGAVTGTVFCSLTLPITNYRYRKSMGMSIDVKDLYQAYLPTVLRDIVYGIVRTRVTAALIGRNAEFAKSNLGRFVNMFLTVAAACVISAPGNEFRGFMLQPKDRSLPFGEFFQPIKFIRSTFIGMTIMSTALASGALATPVVESYFNRLRAYLSDNPLSYLLIALFFGHHYLKWKAEERKGDAKKAAK